MFTTCIPRLMESKLSINAEDFEEDKNDRSWLQRTGTQGRCDDQSPVLLSVVTIGERSSARRSETCVSATPDITSRTSKYVGMEVRYRVERISNIYMKTLSTRQRKADLKILPK
jgi:hypothetical protein